MYSLWFLLVLSALVAVVSFEVGRVGDVFIHHLLRLRCNRPDTILEEQTEYASMARAHLNGRPTNSCDQ